MQIRSLASSSLVLSDSLLSGMERAQNMTAKPSAFDRIPTSFPGLFSSQERANPGKKVDRTANYPRGS